MVEQVRRTLNQLDEPFKYDEDAYYIQGTVRNVYNNDVYTIDVQGEEEIIALNLGRESFLAPNTHT